MDTQAVCRHETSTGDLRIAIMVDLDMGEKEREAGKEGSMK